MKGEIIMFHRFRKNKKGFTLIELIVVIAILAILAAIAIPTFSGITKEADAKVVLANARNLATAINAYNNLNPGEEITEAELTVSDLTSKLGDLYPSGLGATEAGAALDLIAYSNSDYVAVAGSSSDDTTPTATPES
jgi:type IV pilus assembly protein PilA